MNETLLTLFNRRSVRAYAPDPISDEEKDLVLKAAFRAPTAGNMMLYTIIEVNDPQLKETLSQTCDHQPFIAKAPWVLLFLADYQRWMDYYTLSGVEARCGELNRPYRTPEAGDLMLASCDALIAAQNAVIAAESLGIGSCYIGDILEQYETHQKLFNLPPYVLPITLLCFGRPLKAHDAQSGRFDRKFVVHTDRYQRLTPSEFEEMFQDYGPKDPARFVDGALNPGQHMYFRKFGADFSIEMNRSVNEMLKNWR